MPPALQGSLASLYRCRVPPGEGLELAFWERRDAREHLRRDQCFLCRIGSCTMMASTVARSLPVSSAVRNAPSSLGAHCRARCRTSAPPTDAVGLPVGSDGPTAAVGSSELSLRFEGDNAGFQVLDLDRTVVLRIAFAVLTLALAGASASCITLRKVSTASPVARCT